MTKKQPSAGNAFQHCLGVRQSQRGQFLRVHQDFILPKRCSRRRVPRALAACRSRAAGQGGPRTFSSVPWQSVFEGLGVHERWSVLKNHRLKAQEQAIPLCRKSSKQGPRPAWFSRELLLEVRRKKEIG